MADSEIQTTSSFTPLPKPTVKSTSDGILSGAMTPAPAPAPTAAPAPSTGIIGSAQAAQLSTPTAWNVTPDQTVAGQTTALMNPDNPLIQQAVTQAKQNQVANGTLNSSIANTAGLSAAYSAITPIATADAATASKAASYNADTANQFAVKNVDSTNSMTQANLSSATSQSIAKLNSETTTNIAKMDNESKLQLQKLQNDNATLLSTNSQAASLMTSATAALNNITQSTSMDAAAKTEASKQVWANLTAQLSVLGKTSGLDLSSILSDNPYAVGAATTTTTGQPAIKGADGSVIPTSGNGYTGLTVSNGTASATDSAGNPVSVSGDTVTGTVNGQPTSVSLSSLAQKAAENKTSISAVTTAIFGPVVGAVVNLGLTVLGFFGGSTANGKDSPNSVGGIFNYGNSTSAGFNTGYSASQNQAGMGGWGGGGNSSSENGGGDSSRGSQSDNGGRNGGDSGGF